MSQENLQTMIMQNVLGGVREVYYGIVQVVNDSYSLTPLHSILHLGGGCVSTNSRGVAWRRVS